MGRTLVVNIRMDDYDAYIGRAGHGQSGYFGNPHPVGKPCRECSLQRPVTHTLAQAMMLYRGYFYARIKSDPEFRKAVEGLKGKRLGCFCAKKGGATAADPHVCHGQVIAAYLDGSGEAAEVK